MSQPGAANPADPTRDDRPTPLGTPEGASGVPTGEEVTLPAGDDGGVPDPERGRFRDPAADGSAAAATPAPQSDAEELESALREGGPIPVEDNYAEARRRQPAEPGPGTSLT